MELFSKQNRLIQPQQVFFVFVVVFVVPVQVSLFHQVVFSFSVVIGVLQQVGVVVGVVSHVFVCVSFFVQ